MQNNECEISIIHLNYDCLEIILEYLTMEDHVSFAETCEISKYELKTLSIVSKNVQKLSIHVDDLVDSLARNYANQRKYYFNKFVSLIVDMQQLHSLNLWQFRNKSYAKRILRNARNLKHLKQLHISDHKCGYSVLKPFDQLELLSMDVQLSSRALRKACRSMNNLRELHLRKGVGTSSLKYIIQRCPHLQELSFYIKPQSKTFIFTNTSGGCPEKIFCALADSTKNLISLTVVGIISDLKQAVQLARIISLRFLTCSFSNPDCVQALGKLSLLEELRISLVDCSVDISAIYLELIRRCSQLRLLRILDFNIREDFAIRISKMMQEFENRRPLQLFIYGHRESTFVRTSNNIDSTHLIYKRMNAQELIKLL